METGERLVRPVRPAPRAAPKRGHYSWVEVLWLVMARTQKGFRKVSTRRVPRRKGPRNAHARRADKIGVSSWLRRYRGRYA